MCSLSATGAFAESRGEDLECFLLAVFLAVNGVNTLVTSWLFIQDSAEQQLLQFWVLNKPGSVVSSPGG